MYLSHFYKQFNRGMVLKILGAHLFFDDEDVVSARRKWLISPLFRRALTSSTHQKVDQMHDKTYISPYEFMIIVPRSPSKSPPNGHLGRRHDNGNTTTTANEGIFAFPNAPGRGQPFLLLYLPFFMGEGPVSTQCILPARGVDCLMLLHGQRSSR